MNARAIIQWGDLGAVAAHYASRPAYAEPVVDCMISYTGSTREGYAVADIGAGTGKLTAMLAERGLSGFAIEPSEGMLAERPRTGARGGALHVAARPGRTVGTAGFQRRLSLHGYGLPLDRPGAFNLGIPPLPAARRPLHCNLGSNDPHEDALMQGVEELIEAEIGRRISGKDTIVAAYPSHSWTVRAV